MAPAKITTEKDEKSREEHEGKAGNRVRTIAKRPDERVFMDSAATSFPKPPCVIDAVDDYLREVRCSLNRGGHTEACVSGKVARETRQMVADLFDYPERNHVVFTQSVTYALNMVLKGVLHDGDHVLISAMEHNAVLRPMNQLTHHGITYDIIPADAQGRMDTGAIEGLIKLNTRAIVCTHASNVSGNIQPVERIGALAHRHGLLFILDTAQTAGAIPISMKCSHIDILCFTAHKGLMAPPGLGGFIMPQEIADNVEPLIAGGTGIFSDDPEMPPKLPFRFEAGTPNLPALFGLHASLKYIDRVGGPEAIGAKERKLYEVLLEGVQAIPQIQLHGENDPALSTATLAIDYPEYDNAEVAYYLDHRYNIATRTGLHCAPLVHRTLGTYPKGTLRCSLGYFTRKSDVALTLKALAEAPEHLVLLDRKRPQKKEEGAAK